MTELERVRVDFLTFAACDNRADEIQLLTMLDDYERLVREDERRKIQCQSCGRVTETTKIAPPAPPAALEELASAACKSVGMFATTALKQQEKLARAESELEKLRETLGELEAAEARLEEIEGTEFCKCESHQRLQKVREAARKLLGPK